MDWLRNIISKLPMETISEYASRVTIWWSNMVADVPPDLLPIYAYVGFSIIVLLLWLFIVRLLPSPIGGISWLAVFAILLTPGTAVGDSGDVAPASIGVIYGILMKEPGIALRSLLPILVVFAAGLILGFIWQVIKNIMVSNAERSQQQAIRDEKATVQLASANYIDLIEGKSDSQQLVKTKRSVPTSKRNQATSNDNASSVKDKSADNTATKDPSSLRSSADNESTNH